MGVCDAVHLLARYAEAHGDSTLPKEGAELALCAVTKDIGGPCLVTSLTTAGALLSFTTSGLDTFVRFGAISAFGVMCCLLLTFTCLPLLCLGIRPDVRARRTALGPPIRSVPLCRSVAG